MDHYYSEDDYVNYDIDDSRDENDYENIKCRSNAYKINICLILNPFENKSI